MKSKAVYVLVGVLICLVIALGAGALAFSYGKQVGREAAREGAKDEVRKILDNAFPPPPEQIFTLSGEIKELVGGTIVFEINDPSDYLPHADGTPRNKQIRRADMRSGTAYFLVDYTKPTPSGDPSVSSISFSDLKIGNRITVKSAENVKTTERFVASEVRRVKL